MNKIIVICGPTATGKTKLALNLAQKYRGEIVAADSRQVYQDMDIGTGKDIPLGSVWHPDAMLVGYWRTKNGISIWGYDIADPRKSFSVSHYIAWANKVLESIWSRGNIPIIVGGTGLYVKALIDGVGTLLVSPNPQIRAQFESKTTDELFDTLSSIDPFRAGSMNDSDRKNPRRLLRAIEVGLSQQNHEKTKIIKLEADVLWIGLNTDSEVIKMRISNRVFSRMENGFEKEVRILLSHGIDMYGQAMSSFGYSQISSFLQGEISLTDALKLWIQAEHKYLKKQRVWFKKENRIVWFDINDPKFETKIKKHIEKKFKFH